MASVDHLLSLTGPTSTMPEGLTTLAALQLGGEIDPILPYLSVPTRCRHAVPFGAWRGT